MTFTLQVYGKIFKYLLFRVKELKLPNFFSIMEDYLIGDDPGAACCLGTGKGHLRSCDAINRFFVNKSRHDGAEDF